MVCRAVQKLNLGSTSLVAKVASFIRLVLVAGWPAVFVLTEDTRVHHTYLLLAGNAVSFLHSGLNDCLLAHIAVAATFFFSLVARPPYRVWGIGSISYSTIVFFAHACGPRLPRGNSVYDFLRVREKPA